MKLSFTSADTLISIEDSENPPVAIEKLMLPHRATFWRNFWTDSNVGPLFSKNKGAAITVNVNRFCSISRDYLFPSVEEKEAHGRCMVSTAR